MRFRPSQRGGVLLAAGLAVTVFACARNPVTGHRELALMSESQEIALGKESDQQIVAAYGVYDDPALQEYVNAIGQKMAKLSHRPNLQFTFRVLDSPVVNAFALPGGYVYITRGILAHMNNEAELAMVVGHEIGHVTARHGVQQYSRQQLAGLGLGLGSVFIPQVARFERLAQTALGLLFLKYGRGDETQADELGVEYSMKAGYDASIGTRFFEVLDRMSQESGQSLPSWLSTHPAPADRVQRTHDLALADKATYPGSERVAEAVLKGKVDNVVFGDDPRQGFVDHDGIFKHPGLRFQIDFPSGWPLQNSPGAVVAAEPNQRAVVQLTLEKSEGLAPQQFAARAAQSTQATITRSGAESIHGFDSYIAVLQIPVEGGGTTPVFAAFVQRERGGPMYQIVGQAAPGAFDSFQGPFLASARSLQALTDPSLLAIQPNRVDVETVRGGTTLQQAAEKAKGPVPVGTIALINNLQPTAQLAPGFQLKVVRGSFRPPQAAGGGD